jgi:hypothetical protein
VKEKKIMKKLIFQVDISGYDHEANNFWRPFTRVDGLYEHSKESVMRYAKRLGSDYMVLSQAMVGDLAPTYQRLAFYKLFEKFDYDLIIYMDCDQIILDPDTCPDIFEYNEFCGVQNCDGDPEVTHPTENPMHGIAPGYKKFFNPGILLLTREFYEATKDHWEAETEYWSKRNNDSIHDGSILNCLAYKHWPHDRIILLDTDFGSWWKGGGKYIEHYGTFRKHEYFERFHGKN